MTESSLTLRAGLAPWHSGREAVRAVLLLAAREVRTASRTPAYLVPNLLVPIFFAISSCGLEYHGSSPARGCRGRRAEASSVGPIP